jgi:hypothetical protein
MSTVSRDLSGEVRPGGMSGAVPTKSPLRKELSLSSIMPAQSSLSCSIASRPLPATPSIGICKPTGPERIKWQLHETPLKHPKLRMK